jgi:hypothetical protein
MNLFRIQINRGLHLRGDVFYLPLGFRFSVGVYSNQYGAHTLQFGFMWWSLNFHLVRRIHNRDYDDIEDDD